MIEKSEKSEDVLHRASSEASRSLTSPKTMLIP